MYYLLQTVDWKKEEILQAFCLQEEPQKNKVVHEVRIIPSLNHPKYSSFMRSTKLLLTCGLVPEFCIRSALSTL
ncbi:hypothetical protein Bca4012_010369 [Brassica carinata]